jgi:serine/threonine-protein kinase RsbW
MEPDMLIYTIQLAVQEICVNIVTHAYDGIAHGQIQVVMTLDDISRRLVVELIDHGHPFQPELVPAPPLDDIQEHGYGLFLARELLDEVHYEARANTNYWRLSKYL